MCLLLSAILFVGKPVWADEQVFELTSQEWNVPRNEATILAMPALQKLIHAYQQTSDAMVLIKYPGGDEGTLWVSELRAWLISLGIASNTIQTAPGSRDQNTLELHLVENKQKS
jgi:hypothetical protein